MAVIPSSPTEPVESVSEMESLTNTNDSGNEVQKDDSKKAVPGSAKPRNRNPGIRIVGNRIYDSENGKSCHQCRQKTKDLAAECKNPRNNKKCPIKYCHKCLLNRYGEKAEEVENLPDWFCPKCRGICNCSLCMKKRGQQPTGILIHTAKANGYSSVSEMLQVDGATNLNCEKSVKDFGSSPEKKAESEKESSISLSRKRLKEDTFGEVESNSQPFSSPPSHDAENSKKTKLEELRAKHEDNTNDQVEGQEEKSTGKNENKEADFEMNVDSPEKAVVPVPEIILPVGTELTTLKDIQVLPEDIGKALQFLEFCAAFGKILEVKRGQPECILRDLVDGRSSRTGRLSLAVQLHIRLISLIKEDRGEGSSDLSPTRGKDSWIHALKECIDGSDSESKLPFLEHLDNGADGYENLISSDKLMILNLLCDEVLGTAEIRSWIDDQILEHAEKAKEHKGRICAAKDKEKHLKQKIQDEVAKAIIEKNGGPLTISEHEALAPIKLEAAQAHSEMLESVSTYKKRIKSSKAVRTENIHLGTNGCVYWKLNCLSESSEILVQDLGKDITSSEERWFSLDDEQKEVVEKHVSSLRRRRRRSWKVTSIQSSGNNDACPSGDNETSLGNSGAGTSRDK